MGTLPFIETRRDVADVDFPPRALLLLSLFVHPPSAPLVPSRPATPTGLPQSGPAELSPLPATPPSIVLPRPASRAASRQGSPSPNLVKMATQRARAMSNQPVFQNHQQQAASPANPTMLIDPPSPQLGKHAREVGGGSSSSGHSAAASPRKKRRVDEVDEQPPVEMDVDADGDENGSVAHAALEKGKQKETIAEEPEVPHVDANLVIPDGSSSQPFTSSSSLHVENSSDQPVRAASQPARSARTTRGGLRSLGGTESAGGVPSRKSRTRAGSAGISGSRRTNGPSAGAALPPVREWEVGRFSVGGTPLEGANGHTSNDQEVVEETTTTTTTTITTAQEVIVQPDLPTPPPPPPFVLYPLPGDPVEEIKALSHFGSGSDFGGGSKQNYQTDWHEPLVLDDPMDAETVRRAQALAGGYDEPEPPMMPHHPEEDDNDGVAIGLLAHGLGEPSFASNMMTEF